MHARRLYAHRGASAEAPENTMVAFERAAELGVDALELDVHLTRDGHLIVVHDDTAARTTGARLAWADLDLAEARRLDAGWGYVAPDGTRPFAGKGVTVPTFEELLQAFPRMPLNVDLKSDGAAEVMLALLRRYQAEERVTLASFHLKTLTQIRRAGFAGETGLSQSEIGTLLAMPGVLWRQLPFTGTSAQVPTHHGKIHFDRPSFIAKCHSLGLRIDFWTVDDPAEATRLLQLGADGIMTNDPAAVRPAFGVA